MTTKDWTLLVVAAGNKALQPVQLQKSLFLLGQNLSVSQLHVDTFYEFEPYDYGPFCGQVYSDAEELSAEGLIRIDQPARLSYRLYVPTDEGRDLAAKLRQDLDADVRDYLDRVVGWTISLTFKELLSAVYRAFPEMKKNSVFQE